MITLNATARDVKVNPKLLRRQGLVPAVFYGRGAVATAISVDKIEFTKVLSEAGESSIIALKTNDGVLDALIHDVALDPVLGDPIHVDFYITAKDQKIEVDIPLEFVGVAPAEKLGGIVMKILHELRIEALPSKLPQHIEVDLTKLAALDSHITVGDLALPEGVDSVLAPTEMVAVVTQAQEEEEVVAPVDLSAIEVEKKGKKEGEGEEAAPEEKK